MSDNINILELASAKLPPDQTPALLEDLMAIYSKVVPTTAGAKEPHPTVKAAFIAVVDALKQVQLSLVAQQQNDSLLVDQDFDAAGYGILDACNAKERIFSSRAVPLSPSHQQLVEDVALVRSLFVLESVQGREIFLLAFVQEYNAIKIVLAKSKAPKAAAAIARLGFVEDFERFAQCHERLRLLVGVGTVNTSTEGTAFENFEAAKAQLAGAMLLFLGKDTDEHRYWRALILGPLIKHIEQYRERRRKQAEKDRRKAENNTPSTDPSTATD